MPAHMHAEVHLDQSLESAKSELCMQVRDGVITLLEAWGQVSSPDRVLPGLADYLTSPKAAMAEGKVPF